MTLAIYYKTNSHSLFFIVVNYSLMVENAYFLILLTVSTVQLGDGVSPSFLLRPSALSVTHTHTRTHTRTGAHARTRTHTRMRTHAHARTQTT